ncbi:lipocalin family protein [Solitalea canadensis]|uniref:Lipocalin-like domain-containing protein n=1 Tax=Solitalea canadensis (strain ATCC 29591 / DSM 3403 / JCM 21819 / LMG 8368 / NBRC 15130 / NCIMB 12057 / USAM 9D) TaxID=929556 RepID=H8KS72_SOLCM|nr:lipocalin family protein [Solitalea canadensis]AFD07860.1 hypothetical protein Solca_2834 [Solitalea canadensis DSM 3403]
MKLNLLFTLLTASFIFSAVVSKAQADPKLLGKWQVLTKSENEKDGPIVIESKNKIYTAGQKTYEFSDKSVVISETGDEVKTKAVTYSNNSITIGDNKYTYSIDGKKLTLTEVETKTKKGKSIIETEEYVLERVQ